MAINAKSDIQAHVTAMTSTGHTFAISSGDVVTETPTVGPSVVYAGISAAQNDAARAEALIQVHHDITNRTKPH